MRCRLLLLLGLAGCMGASRAPGAPGAGGAAGAGGAGGQTIGALDCREPKAAPLRGRLLSPSQYDNAVRDLVGVSVPGGFARGFAGGADAQLDELDVEQRAAAAAAVARQAAAALQAWSPCDPREAGALACAQRIVAEVGARAFRRPLSAVEGAQLGALFSAGLDDKDFATGVEWFLTGLLQSPDFLYQFTRPAPGERAGQVAPLSSFEIASRLSLFLWDSIPDDELLAAAAAGGGSPGGGLADEAGLRAQIDRMLRDPKLLRGVESFYSGWLALDRFGEVARDDPAFTTAVTDALRSSVLMGVAEVYAAPAPSLGALFSGQSYFMNGTLRAFYGVHGGGAAGAITDDDGSDFTASEMPGEGRRGLLTHPGLMALLARANASNPVARGLFVRRALLCQEIPPPTGIDIPPLPPLAPGGSTRARLEAHTNNQGCAVCHALIDPPGFAFEGFDQVGRRRASDGGKPVDSSGVMTGAGDLDGPFADGDELLRRIAGSADVARCFAGKYLAHALARSLLPADQCSLEGLRQTFVPSGDLRRLVADIAGSPAFRLRLTEGEAAP